MKKSDDIPEASSSLGMFDESAGTPCRPCRINSERTSLAIVSPSISMVVPAYNAERYIGFTIESLVGQTHEDLEIIIVDDGSTDGTHEIACKYARADHRVTVLKQTCLSAGTAAHAAAWGGGA